MTNVSLGKKRFERGILTLLLFVGILVNPLSASASTVLPTQILPGGPNRVCPAVTFSDIRAYVYDGNLNSFDIFVSDPSYVAVSTTVDGVAVPYNHLTRWAGPDGSLKTHTDLQSLPVRKDIKIQMIFLAVMKDSNGAPVTCLLNVPATLPAIGSTGHQGAGGGSSGNIQSQPSSGNNGGSSGSGNTQASGTATSNPGVVAAMNSLGNLCANGGASRLWIVLLVLFGLFTFALSTQKFEINSNVRDWNMGLILAIFVGVLIFWYASAACRTGAWAPTLATLITILGLLYSMLKADDSQQILLLKDGKK